MSSESIASSIHASSGADLLPRRMPSNEGRVDAEGDAIEIITIHSAKGLEWPVVIPVNTATLLRSRESFVHRTSDNTLHWVIGNVVPPIFCWRSRPMMKALPVNASAFGMPHALALASSSWSRSCRRRSKGPGRGSSTWRTRTCRC
ncbi:hypothetical protein X737_26725 [Mesorhizobium sp. L48C026A00]|nr:hypothetical protein X737_26725 [Mesorhizobium sp. L48C026A00]